MNVVHLIVVGDFYLYDDDGVAYYQMMVINDVTKRKLIRTNYILMKVQHVRQTCYLMCVKYKEKKIACK
jgi:hypothetical protein